MDKKARNIEITVGVFVMICLAVAATVFFVLLRKEHTFEPRINVLAVFDDARGLRPGAPVQLSGINVGSVRWVGFDEGNRAKIILSLLAVAQQRVHADAVARIVPMSLVGTDTRVLLTAGSPSSPLIADGMAMRTEEMPNWYDVVNTAAPSLDHLAGLLANLEQLTNATLEPHGAFQTSLKNAANIVAAVDRGEGTLGAFIKDRTVYDDTVKLVADAAQASEQMREISVRLRESAELWPETVAKADQAAETARVAADNLAKLIEQANTVVSNASSVIDHLDEAAADIPAITQSSKKIAANIETITDNLRVASNGAPALVEASRESVEEASGVLKAAKRTWFLRDYFPKKKTDTSITVDRREELEPVVRDKP